MDMPSSPPAAVDAEPVGPKPIRKLTEDVVNRIAAAEVRTMHVAAQFLKESPAAARHRLD